MNRLLPLALLSALMSACQPKEVDCTTVAVKSPCYIAFGGFSDTVLHTVVRSTYRAGTGFSTPIAQDTLYFPAITLVGDTAFSSPTRGQMGTLPAGNDYEITLPGAHRRFRITDLAYSADSVSHWTARKTCGEVHSFSQEPLALSVDRMACQTVALGYGNATRWVILR